ncbi:MAG: peptidoglycan bridge formation glycyltransferase FemA/FemB family protein [Candidatus Delongbacteria bacterium]|jgi:lipid II:glycine glycyltransferase (peptidoglycan interpeptide bridge formation enzyme)|nr:peptidoglycan bridge formation glycyltransferase FemA/FemB family protein [Candidatus Delongbacteria bacterium]
MDVFVQPKQSNHIKSDGILQQTNWWATMKYHQRYHIKSFRISLDQHNSGKRYDDLLVMLRHEKAQNQCMAYIPYGPEIEPKGDEKGMFLENLAMKLKPRLPANCALIRFDIKWEAPWFNDHNRYNNLHEWNGIPGEHTQELRMNFCTEHHNLYKAPSDVLPSSTVYLNLENSNQQLLYNMKAKTRYNIRLSMRRNIHVREADVNELDTWNTLYKLTAKRNNFFCHPREFFESMLYANKKNQKSQTGSCLLIAEHHNEPLAAMWLGISGTRAT